MKRCRVFDDSHVFLKKNDTTTPCASELLDSLWVQSSSPSFHGTASMVNFNHDDCREENCDDGLNQPPEKKRRLTAEQVQFLEKSFDLENKLEPDRKIQLAKELGLQPRQVAIWFQNRRARYKTKLLEKDYDSLKSCYDKLKADYDTLFSDNEKLKNEVHLLSQKLGAKDGCGGGKPEDASSSARSDVLDSDSSGALEIASRDHFCGDEDERLVQRLCSPKLEAEYYDDEYDDLQPNSCNLGFPAQNQGTWFWQF